METSNTIVPFRWDVSRAHEIAELMAVDPAAAYPAFAEDLRDYCAAVMAAAGDADLVFVGRSPESLFDYLSGAVAGTSWDGRVRLLLVSLRYHRPSVRRIVALQHYLATVGLDPRELPRREHPIALVDLVSSGETFCALVRLLHQWTLETRGDWRAVRERIRIVALTHQSFSVRTRWPQQRRRASGGGLLKRTRVHGVSLIERLWRFLGNEQLKVAQSHTPQRWDDLRAMHAPRDPDPTALRAAVDIFHRAGGRAERELFVTAMSRHGAMRHDAVRRLAEELFDRRARTPR